MENLRTPEMTKNCDISIFQAFPIPDLQKVGFVEYHFFFWHLGRPRQEPIFRDILGLPVGNQGVLGFHFGNKFLDI